MDELVNAVYNVEYCVSAYDESWGSYGENRSREFKDGNAAVEYAKSLADNFHPVVNKVTTMNPVYEKIYDYRDQVEEG